MGFRSTESSKSYRDFTGRTFVSGGGGDSGFPEVRKPPVIGSVGLTTTAGSNRFTSQDFTVTTTMTNDGPPVSQKGVKATVTASLENYPATDTINNVALTIPTSVSYTTTTLASDFNEGSAPFTYFDSTNKIAGFGVFSHNNNGDQVDLYLSSNGTTWTRLINKSSGFNVGNLFSARQVGDYIIAENNDYNSGTSVIARANDLSGFKWQSVTKSLAYDGTQYYYTVKGTALYRYTDPYSNTGESSLFSLSGYFDGRPYVAYGNNRIVICYATSSPTYYPASIVSTDGGNNFSSLSYLANQNSRVTALHFFNGYFYAAVSSGANGLYRSTDGQNWSILSTPNTVVDVCDDGTYLYVVDLSRTVHRSANNGVAWTTLGAASSLTYVRGLATGYGKVLVGGASGTSGGVASATIGSQVLTLDSDQNLSIVDGINTGDFVRMSGGDSSYYSSVISISTGTPSITVGNVKAFSTGTQAIALNPTGVPQESTKYLTIDSSGNVSDMSSADPGFVNYGPGTEVTLSFPATFPTGNAPDVELPAGASIRAEIQAVNDAATDTEVSNIVTPT